MSAGEKILDAESGRSAGGNSVKATIINLENRDRVPLGHMDRNGYATCLAVELESRRSSSHRLILIEKNAQVLSVGREHRGCAPRRTTRASGNRLPKSDAAGNVIGHR